MLTVEIYFLVLFIFYVLFCLVTKPKKPNPMAKLKKEIIIQRNENKNLKKQIKANLSKEKSKNKKNASEEPGQKELQPEKQKLIEENIALEKEKEEFIQMKINFQLNYLNGKDAKEELEKTLDEINKEIVDFKNETEQLNEELRLLNKEKEKMQNN